MKFIKSALIAATIGFASLTAIAADGDLLKVDETANGGDTLYGVQGSLRHFTNKNGVQIIGATFKWATRANGVPFFIAIDVNGCKNQQGAMQWGNDDDHIMYTWTYGGQRMYDSAGTFLCNAYMANIAPSVEAVPAPAPKPAVKPKPAAKPAPKPAGAPVGKNEA